MSDQLPIESNEANEIEDIDEDIYLQICNELDHEFKEASMTGYELEYFLNSSFIRAAIHGRVLLGIKTNGEKRARELGHPRPDHWGFKKSLNEKKIAFRSHHSQLIRLYKQYPGIIESGETHVHRSIAKLPYSSVFALLSAPDEVKSEIEKRLESGETIYRKDIERLKREHKAEQARLQAELEAKDKLNIELTQEKMIRNAEHLKLQGTINRREQEIEAIKKAKYKPVELYVPNDEKAFEQLELLKQKELAQLEHEKNIAQIERDRLATEKADAEKQIAELEERLQEQIRENRHAEVQAIESFKKKCEDEYQALVNRETHKRQDVDKLTKQQTELSNSLNFLHDMRAALKEFRQHLYGMQAAACVLDEPCDDLNANEEWMNALNEGMQILTDLAAQIAPRTKLTVIHGCTG